MQLAAIAIGLLCGAAAALMKWAIDWITNLVFSHFDMHSGNWAFFVIPIAGIFIATAIAKYIVKQPMDHASDRVADGMAKGENRISPKLILGPIVGCTVTLGLGGSAGAEDPITYTGSAIGSNVGKAFRLSQDTLQDLVGIGAGAAIAGIFMAPIGGMMFSLEVLKTRQTLQTVIALVLGSLTSSLTCYILLGCHTDITFVPEMRFDTHLIPMVLICGMVCGLYSAYYSRMMALCRRWYVRFSNIWLRALIGGVILSTLLFFFPSLYGEGYDTVRKLMIDDPIDIISYSPLFRFGHDYLTLLILMASLLLVKPFATSSTNDSGGIGGDFTPTFFCGGVLGFMFAAVANHYLGMHLPYALFAFFGMAAVMAGAVRAPLMAIFIAAEMTGLYGFILPLTLSALASIVTVMLLNRSRLTTPAFLRHKDRPSGT